MYISLAILVFAYLLGSVPFGLLISGMFYKKDLRNFGSGNIGATNAYRTLGVAAGVAVFAADFLKGFIPVTLAKYLLASSPDLVPWISVLAGLMAIVGHSYSIFLGFSGGKGMSTAAGLVFGLWPLTGPVLVSLWVIVVALTRYVSLASILTAITLPISVMFLYPRAEYIAFSLVAGIVIVYRHRSNISRLMRGEELKIGAKVSLKEE